MNIFVTNTAYHILLSYATILNENLLKDNYLFVYSNNNKIDYFLSLFEKTKQLVFTKIIILPYECKRNSKLAKWRMVKNNLATIKKIIDSHKVNRVYVFNDERVEPQATLYYAVKQNRKVRCIYIEDGSGAYNSDSIQKRSVFKRVPIKIFHRVLFGIWLEEISVFGTSHWIKEVKAVFPQFIRSEIRFKKITRISKHPLVEIGKQKFFDNYLKYFGINIDKANIIDAVLIVSHSEEANKNPQYKQIVHRIIDALIDHDYHVAIKYHPSETSKDFLSLRGKRDILILPRVIPMELLYIWGHKRIKLLLGDTSTPLLTAKWLLNDITVFSVLPLWYQVDQSILEVFHKIGIKVVNEIAEIFCE